MLFLVKPKETDSSHDDSLMVGFLESSVPLLLMKYTISHC